jgi:FkbM family methyltransferase
LKLFKEKIIKKFIRKPISTILPLLEKLTGRKIIIQRRNDYSSEFNYGYLSRVADELETLSNYKPKNIFEIGANYGQDADFLKTRFGLKNRDIFIFEPHPEIIQKAKELHDFNCFPYAISDKNEKIIFHAINLKYNNSGVSSLKSHKINDKNIFTDIEVESIRMDKFIQHNNIKEIDFLKVDVEGLSWEVLTGFGQDLKKVKAIQIESEYLPLWDGQKMWEDTYNILSNNGFQLIHFILLEDGIQSDSFWIQRKFVKHKILNVATEKWHAVE